MNPLKGGLDFIKKHPDIIYSLLLIVLVPLALYFNTFFTMKFFDSAVNSFKQEIEYNLATGDLILERVIETFAVDLISNPALLQEKIEEIIKKSQLKRGEEKLAPNIAKIQLEIYEQGKFKTIASYSLQEGEIKPLVGIDREITEAEAEYFIETHKNLAWNQPPGESILFETQNQQGERFRNLTKTIWNAKGEKVGLITMATSLKYADIRIEKANLLMAKAVHRSYIFLTIAILLCLFLIFNHTRLFEYSVLFRKLQEVDKMKDEFISMAAHELRTPITAIRGYADLLKSELSSILNETQSQHISRVIISASRLNDLINDILDVSRIEQGRLSFEFQEISPQKIIKEVVDELKVKADEKGLELIFEPKLAPVSANQQEELYLISADPQRLKQILINLIGNAIKFTLKGKVEIETKIDEIKKRYFIAIRDTGLGMSAEAQKRLFEKFYRVKTKETAEISGTGLGLWITKQLVEKMQGEILLESMEGVGSKFTIIFPLIKKQETPARKTEKILISH